MFMNPVQTNMDDYVLRVEVTDSKGASYMTNYINMYNNS